jgi:hypothetical protein
MKISEDQNEITLDNGVVLVAKPWNINDANCNRCYLRGTDPNKIMDCMGIPCTISTRNDNTHVYFDIKEPQNDAN